MPLLPEKPRIERYRNSLFGKNTKHYISAKDSVEMKNLS